MSHTWRHGPRPDPGPQPAERSSCCATASCGGGVQVDLKFERWLADLSFDDPAIAATYYHYRSTVKLRDSSLAAVEADLESYFDKEPFADPVLRLGAYRGMTHMGGLCLGAEVFDWRRFPGARAFMSFTGLTCSENSTGLTSTGVDHPGRQCPHARPALRSGLDLPAQPRR